MTHRDIGLLWRNAWTLYDSSIEDRTMEIEADYGHQGVGSCPRFAGTWTHQKP